MPWSPVGSFRRVRLELPSGLKHFSVWIYCKRRLGSAFILTSVSVDVGLQVAFLVETLATVRTGVHFDVRVGAHVVSQVSQLFETSPTLLTFVRLLTYYQKM